MSRSNVVSFERDLAGPDSASTTSEPWKCARASRSRPWRDAEALREHLLVGLLERADRREAHRREPLGGLRPDARDDPQRRARQPPARLLAAHRHEPLRLLEVGGDLRDQPVRPDADRDRDAGAVAHLGDQLAQHAQRLLGVGHVGVALVEPDLLHDRQPLPDELPDLARLRPVGLEVGRDEDRLRAQPARLGGGRRRADAELARLVRRGRHDRARPAPGHDDRLADQLRAAQQLDRHVERVAVEMGDDAAGGHDPPWIPRGPASRGTTAVERSGSLAARERRAAGRRRRAVAVAPAASRLERGERLDTRGLVVRGGITRRRLLLDPLAPPPSARDVWDRIEALQPDTLVVLKPDHVRDVDLFVRWYGARRLRPVAVLARRRPAYRARADRAGQRAAGRACGRSTTAAVGWRRRSICPSSARSCSPTA